MPTERLARFTETTRWEPIRATYAVVESGATAIPLELPPFTVVGATTRAGLLTAPLLVRRATDLSRLMVTLGIAMLVVEGANRLSWLTGGADGLQGILIDPLLGRFDFDLAGRTGHAYALAVLAVLFLIARWLMGSRFGLSLRAIRDNPLRAQAIGIPVERRLVAVCTLAAAYAGAAGALMAQTTMFVSLDAAAPQ